MNPRIFLTVSTSILLASGCAARHPGPQNVIYVAVHNLDYLAVFRPADVAEIKLAAASDSANDLHRLEDFIGRPTMGMPRGAVVQDLLVMDDKGMTREGAKIDKSVRLTAPLSQIIPVLETTEAIPQGQVVCNDNVALVDIPVSKFATNQLTELDPPLIATKSFAKGNMVTKDKLVPSIFGREWFAVHDVKSGHLLNWMDFRTHVDNDDVIVQTDKALDSGKDTSNEPLLHFPDFDQHKLARNLKKGEQLTVAAIGPHMVPVVVAAQALAVGARIKSSDLKTILIEEEKSDGALDHPEILIDATVKHAIDKGHVFTIIKDVELPPVSKTGSVTLDNK